MTDSVMGDRTEKRAAGDTEEGTDPTIDQLYRELQSGDVDLDARSVRLTPDQYSEVILDHVMATLSEESGGSGFRFRESTVKNNLDEILLLLVAHRSTGAHGKSLMEDLATLFDSHVSPGTLYPQLHELEDDGLLQVQELVRTKEYRIDDEASFTERVRTAMEQHLVLGLFFRTALTELLSS